MRIDCGCRINVQRVQTLLVDEITSFLVVTDEMFSWAEDSKTNRRPCDPILMSNGLSDWFQWDGKIFYLSTGFNDNNYLIGRYFNLGIPQTLKLVDVIVREQSHGHWKRVKICKIYNYKVHKIKFYRFFIIFITIYQLNSSKIWYWQPFISLLEKLER